MAIRQEDDPLHPDVTQLPLADSRRMKFEIEKERTMNEIDSGSDLSKPLDPNDDSIQDNTLTGEEDPDGRRWLRRTQGVGGQRLAQRATNSVNDASPPPEEDMSNSYIQMAQARSTEAEIADFKEQLRQQRNEEFEKPKQAVPYITPAGGTPTAEGAGSLPWNTSFSTVWSALNKNIDDANKMSAGESLSAYGSGAWTVAKDVAKGTMWESPRAAGRGLTTAGREFVVSLTEMQNWMTTAIPGLNVVRQVADAAGLGDPFDGAEAKLAKALRDSIPKADDLMDKPDSVTGGFIEEAVRFVAAFVPIFRAMQASTAARSFGALGSRIGPATGEQVAFAGSRTGRLARYGNVAGASTVAEGITHPAGDPNIASLIEMAPAFSNVVTQALQTDPNDSVGWAKIKHAISDGFISGMIADGLLYGLRSMSAKQKVIPEIDALERLHGNQAPGTVLADTPDRPALSFDGPPPNNPFMLDVSTPEARAASEERLRPILQGEGGIRIEGQQVYDDVFEQLRAAGRSQEEADKTARIWAQHYATLSDDPALGKSAFEIYKDENVSVQRAVAQEQQAAANDPAMANADQFQQIVKDIEESWPENQIQGKVQLFPDELKLLRDSGFEVADDGMMNIGTFTKLRYEAERVRKGIAKPETAFNQTELPPHINRFYEDGTIFSENRMQHFVDLQEMLRRKATPEEIEFNPIIAAAYRQGAENAMPPTNTRPDYGTPEYMEAREFNLPDGTKVKGYPAAQKFLFDLFSEAAGGPQAIKNEKRAVIVTGPGGAGKSTIMNPLAREIGAAVVDSDEAKRLFPEYDSGLGANAVHEESSFITWQRGGPMDQYLNQGANILVQKIGHSPESLRKLIAHMKAEGYSVSTINVLVSPEEAFRRRVGRYLKTGRINSSGYTHSLKENADQPATTYKLLKEEGSYEEAIQVNLEGRTPEIIEGGETTLASRLQAALRSEQLGQRRSDGQASSGVDAGTSGRQGTDGGRQPSIEVKTFLQSGQLPADTPARMERAKTLGFNRPAFHATASFSDFDQFRRAPDDIGIHFGTAGQANDRIAKEVNKGTSAPARLFPVMLKAEKPLRMEDLGEWTPDLILNQLPAKDFPRKYVDDFLREALGADEYDKAYKNYIEQSAKHSGVSLERAKASVDKRIALAKKEGMKPFTDESSPNYISEPLSNPLKHLLDLSNGKKETDVRSLLLRHHDGNKILQDLIKSKGYDSIVYRNTFEVKDAAGLRDRATHIETVAGRDVLGPDVVRYLQQNAEDSVIVFDPNQIRSVFAEFNPAKADSPRILDQGGVIRSAALKIEGKIYEGPTHFDALMDYTKKTGKDIEDRAIEQGFEDDGFVTRDGRFVSREEAARIVDEASPARAGARGRSLASEDLRMNGGSFDQSQPFYSSVERTIQSSSTKTATGPQWLGALRNTPGIKKEELEWLGLTRFLGEAKGQVTKADVEAYVAANRVEIKEIEKGGPNYAHDPQQPFSRENIDEAREYLQNFEIDVRRLNDDQIIQRANDEYVGAEGEFGRDQLGADDPLFRDRQLPGGENYRELLLQLPTKDQPIKVEVKRSGNSWQIFTNGRRTGSMIDGINGGEPLSEAQALQAARQLAPDNFVGRSASEEGAFRTSHWEEPNVLAHARMNDRVINGKKTLFIEEIQSDWHQTGRRHGYAGQEKIEYELEGNGPWVIRTKDGRFVHDYNNKQLAEEALGHYQSGRLTDPAHMNLVPDAPFKKTWHELVMKRMIRLAADEGYEQIAWTTGRQQADRYDLSKQVDSIEATLNADGTYKLTALQVDSTRGPISIGDAVKPEDLAQNIGKDLADKIIKDGGGEYSGTDLRVGGEGMAGFYDKMLVTAANDIGKPFGAKAGRADLEGSNHTWRELTEDDPEFNGIEGLEIRRQNGQMQLRDSDGTVTAYDEEGNLVKPNLEATSTSQVHTLELTPQLKETAKEQGFKLFQDSGDPVQPPLPGAVDPRGRITLGESQKLIQLFSKADASTFMHESAHLWLDELIRFSEKSPALKADLDETLRWMGVDDASKITREHHERWAASFEQYLATGEAPSEALKGAFERFKDWLISIYRSVTGITGTELSPEIKGVFDRMLASNTELAASGRRRIFDDEGNIAPELAPLIQSRLAEQGHDAIMFTRPDAGPAVTRFDPSLMGAMKKIDDAFGATETGVPTATAAQGLRVGVTRVMRAADEGQGPAPEVYVNLGRINAANDVKQVIQDMADAFRSEIDEASRGIQTNEQTARLADTVGMTVEELLQRQRGQTFNAEQSLAARRLLTTSAEQLNSLAQKAALPNSSLADQYNFRKMLAIHHAIQSEVIAARTETARALQSWSINAGSNIEMSRDIQSLIDSMGGSKTAQAMAQATADLFKAGVPPGAIAAMTKRGATASFVDAARELFTLGLLWNPATHIANFSSNIAVAFMQVHERASARMIGDLLDTGEGRIVAGEALAMTYGMIASLKDAFKLAGVAVIKGRSEFGTGTKMDDNFSAISSDVVSREKGHTLAEAEKFAATPLGRFIDFLGHVNQIPGHLLAAEDEFAKTIVWRGEVYAQALRQATEEGLTGFNERWARMRELANDPPEHIRLAAVDSASYATFQSKMGNIGQGLMSLRSGRLSPVFMVLPFVKTPTNILSYTFERTPLAPLVARWRDDFTAGGARRDLALAKMATGTAITALALDAASNGYITGAGPSDPGKKESWQRQGWQQNSIRIGDKYYSFQRADPIGMLFGFAGTVAESLKAQDITPEKYDQASEIVAAIIATFSASVVDKTYFQGIEGVMRAIQSSESGAQGVQNLFNRQTGALLPFSSAFNFHRRFHDPVQREVNSPLDAIQTRLIDWSRDLPPRRDLWGKEIAPQEVFGRAYDILSPFAVSKRIDSPIDAEIERLNISVRRIQHKGDFAGADVNFHEWPQVYDRYVQLVGNELKHPVWGLGLKDFLDQVVSGKHALSEQYKTLMSDEHGKGAWIRNQITAYKKLAQQQIMTQEAEKYPKFIAWVTARNAQLMEMRLPPPLQGQGLTER